MYGGRISGCRGGGGMTCRGIREGEEVMGFFVRNFVGS